MGTVSQRLTGRHPKSRCLKPHGSVNWIAWLFEGSKDPGPAFQSIGNHPMVDNTDASLPKHRKEILNPEFTGGALTGSVSLVLPLHSKRFSVPTTIGDEWVAFYEHLWNNVVRALRQSEQIVVIGYSMPEADKQARGAILHHANKNAPIQIY